MDIADVYTNPEKHVVLHNNVKMPILGLGTSHDGGYNHEAVVFALKNCGYRHIDTAKRYGCEKYIAQAIKVNHMDSSLGMDEKADSSLVKETDYRIEEIKLLEVPNKVVERSNNIKVDRDVFALWKCSLSVLYNNE
ncbi:hypothetical protein SK128_020971 [Halocaridina rubra]|uniref:NADP-dependent oxidoreductase domain-containing protein n=1 Tax=Halocaridina rubra TaxID=373956 RepID=A0AAN8WQ29_HALRR